MQYLCYEYTVLQFILATIVCMGGALLSIPLNKNKDKKKTVKNVVITASVFAALLIGLMLVINAIIGNGELNQIALIIPVYLSFIFTTVLVLLNIFKMFDKKILKAILSVILLIGFAVGSYSYIVPFIINEIYKDYKAPVPVLSTYIKTEDGDKMIILRNYWDDVSSPSGDPLVNGTIGYVQNGFKNFLVYPYYINGGGKMDTFVCNFISDTNEHFDDFCSIRTRGHHRAY